MENLLCARNCAEFWTDKEKGNTIPAPKDLTASEVSKVCTDNL